MKTIWKFTLPITDDFELEMPREAKLIHLGEQNGELCLWAVVNPNAEKVRRGFCITGTGNPLPDKAVAYWPHVGSAQVGPFVWHVFDCGES